MAASLRTGVPCHAAVGMEFSLDLSVSDTHYGLCDTRLCRGLHSMGLTWWKLEKSLEAARHVLHIKRHVAGIWA
jgi:hypothetical protein